MSLIKVLLSLVSLTALAQSTPDAERACLDCHLSGSWFPLSEQPLFNHNQHTNFELRESHLELKCTQCHSGDSIDDFHQFLAKGTDCVSCHQDVHQNYWGNDCETCHSPESWDIGQAFRRHDETLFPLQASHHTFDCYLCHTTPGQIPSLECQNCHDTDFLPELTSHDGLTSRTDCSTCHAPTRWNQILALNHDGFFPIYSGRHRGEWNSCSTCHTRSGDYQTFSCTGSGCHSISRMNSKHCEEDGCERRNGLTYPSSGVTSEDCYFCHPRGNE
jgi:hypothetical protein